MQVLKIAIVSATLVLVPSISQGAQLNSAAASFSGLTLDSFSCTRTHETFASPSRHNGDYDDLWSSSETQHKSSYGLPEMCPIDRTIDPAPVPEPSSMAMLAIGLLGALGLLGRRARSAVKEAHTA